MTIAIVVLGSLLVSALSIAYVVTLKNTELRGRLKNINEELTATRSELSALKEKKDKDISDIMKTNETRINELLETISKLEKKLTEKKPAGPPPHIPNFTDTPEYKAIGGR